MNRRFRLTRSTDYKRVRRIGRSYAHPLLVLIVLPADPAHLRFAVSAGRSVGGAVQRNRAKRQIRAALSPLLPAIKTGFDAVCLARTPMSSASFAQVRSALILLLQRAALLPKPYDDNPRPHA